jgi:tetratricopeptide (TPR) repeat protein
MDLSVSSDAIDYLFSSTMANTQANLDALSGTVLGQGIDLFQGEKYELAITAFRRTAALSPSTDNASSAYSYRGQAYVKLEETDNAINTYKEAISLFPTNDAFHLALGDIYLKEKMLEEAQKEFEAAVKLNPGNAESLYSLGQSYLTAGELDNARDQFAKIVQLTSTSATGYYGLGQVARASGDQQDAVSQLTRAIRVNKDFELAYVELGYAYADMGEFLKAQDQLAILKAKDSDKTIALEGYITKARQPRILTAQANNGFNTGLAPQTAVSDLASKLEVPNKSKLFSMRFAFSKDMDTASITNPYNWKISRATIRDNGGVYNYGLPPKATEAVILPKPAYVTYSAKTNTATVRFWLSQNSNTTATIDPSHIVFKFSGVDTYGKAMDTTADEYSGFSGVA